MRRAQQVTTAKNPHATSLLGGTSSEDHGRRIKIKPLGALATLPTQPNTFHHVPPRQHHAVLLSQQQRLLLLSTTQRTATFRAAGSPAFACHLILTGDVSLDGGHVI